MSVSPERLSRLVSRALRHEPGRLGVELDSDGWVAVEELLTAIRARGGRWSSVSRADLEAMVQGSAKRRHEIRGSRIRALYGHSVPVSIHREPVEPPELLYHGTTPRAWERIRREGLRPMGRQQVHLSVDVATAIQVGHRRCTEPVVLVVDARQAYDAGTSFYKGNDDVWLSAPLPPALLRPVQAQDHPLPFSPGTQVAELHPLRRRSPSAADFIGRRLDASL